MAAAADIDIRDMPDIKLILTYLKTGKAPNAEIEEYVEKIRVAYFNMQYEMAMCGRMYFEPKNSTVGEDDLPSENDRAALQELFQDEITAFYREGGIEGY